MESQNWSNFCSFWSKFRSSKVKMCQKGPSFGIFRHKNDCPNVNIRWIYLTQWLNCRLNGVCCPQPYSAYTSDNYTNSPYDAVNGARYSGVYTTVDPVPLAGAFGTQPAGDFVTGAGGECSIVTLPVSQPPPGYTSVIVDAQQYQLGLGADFPVHWCTPQSTKLI